MHRGLNVCKLQATKKREYKPNLGIVSGEVRNSYVVFLPGFLRQFGFLLTGEI